MTKEHIIKPRLSEVPEPLSSNIFTSLFTEMRPTTSLARFRSKILSPLSYLVQPHVDTTFRFWPVLLPLTPLPGSSSGPDGDEQIEAVAVEDFDPDLRTISTCSASFPEVTFMPFQLTLTSVLQIFFFPLHLNTDDGCFRLRHVKDFCEPWDCESL